MSDRQALDASVFAVGGLDTAVEGVMAKPEVCKKLRLSVAMRDKGLLF